MNQADPTVATDPGQVARYNRMKDGKKFKVWNSLKKFCLLMFNPTPL